MIENGKKKATSEDTPQSAVISPLLLNIALNGLEGGTCRAPLAGTFALSVFSGASPA
ncbi:hypothetical protein ABZY14_22665 [Streptomyces sp. NPDC006617]|uniref:hypothetical protein n=1 Tax=Streptomyces sp. NPDC006617 TaxID=3155354 RepID=UPI0033B7E5F2